MAYVSHRPCGCFAAIMVDRGGKDTAKFVAAEVRHGCHIQRVTVEAGRELMKGAKWGPCVHELAAKSPTRNKGAFRA